MKRSIALVFSCLAIAGSAWLAHAVWGQTPETREEKKVTITKSEYERLVAAEVAKAVAAEREKAAHDKPATDEQVLNPQNWHKAIFNKAEYVVYTGPGTVMFHHWVETGRPPAAKASATKAGTPTAPASKGN